MSPSNAKDAFTHFGDISATPTNKWESAERGDSTGSFCSSSVAMATDSSQTGPAEAPRSAGSHLLAGVTEDIENYHRAILNILDDFRIEKEKSRQFQLATMNILEDIEIERQKVASSRNLLEEVNKELETFSYTVSHDLQAPLRAINGFSQVILEDYIDKLDPEGKRYFELIQKNAHLMGQLIQDLLAFSRLGRQKIVTVEINMEELVREVFEELKSLLPNRKIEFKLRPLPKVIGDLMMLRQVFVNLLSNALKFTKGREIAMIEVGFRQEENEGFYYVKDNGVGFDMRYVDKLFGVFQRLHTVEEFEGSGIGLALVKRIITRHNGKVWADGIVNQGVCFYLSIPEKK